jgi:hypothetical protein
MQTPRPPIADLKSLDLAIRELRQKTEFLEDQLDERFGYLQENYSSMVMKSVFPAMQQNTGIPATVLEVVFQNPRIRESFKRLTEQLFNRVSDGMDFLAEKMEKKS